MDEKSSTDALTSRTSQVSAGRKHGALTSDETTVDAIARAGGRSAHLLPALAPHTILPVRGRFLNIPAEASAIAHHVQEFAHQRPGDGLNRCRQPGLACIVLFTMPSGV
jgi:hypothetical protein